LRHLVSGGFVTKVVSNYIYYIMEIKKVTIESEIYPEILKKIPDPPKIIYFLGELKNKENCFAIVGTRKCTNYGKEVTLKIAGELAETKLTIVSGLAPGIDTMAHLAAVERGKRTIAILGTGLDEESIYPKSNLKLVKKILEKGGCLISEYPPKQRGTKFTFPRRNRIISGISLGVLVVEAPERSGALITANFAFLQKRRVFAVPGSIFSKHSKGCHLLIKKGAKLVEKAEDILEELKIPFSQKERKLKGETKTETLILEALKDGALYIDEIVEKTKLPINEVLTTLSLLEIKEKVRNLGGNIYGLGKKINF